METRAVGNVSVRRASAFALALVSVQTVYNGFCCSATGDADLISLAKCSTVGDTDRMAIALTAENLCIERGGRLVLEGVGFSVAGGEALIVTGPNGAGKTTLLRAIAGFLTPVAGQFHLENDDPERELGQHCHYAGHLDAVKPRLSVIENLNFWAGYLGGRPAHVTAALAAFDLSDLADVPAAYLSAGQRRRLGLARLLAAERAIWLLDEPTVSLDQESRTRFAEVVRAHLASGGLAIAATHADLGLGSAKSLRLSATRKAAV